MEGNRSECLKLYSDTLEIKIHGISAFRFHKAKADRVSDQSLRLKVKVRMKCEEGLRIGERPPGALNSCVP